MKERAQHHIEADARLASLERENRELAEAVAHMRSAERGVRESEERFRAVFEYSPDAIFIEDRSGTILNVNPAACELHAMPREKLIGKNVADLVPDSEKEQVIRDFMGWFDSSFDSYEGRSLTGDNRVIDVEIMGRPMKYDGKPAVLLHVRDITYRKRQEREQRRIDEQLQHTQKLESLGVLAGGIAHDFNNLLVGVLGNAELLSDDLPETSETRECLKEIEDAARQAAELCREMLAYSGRARFVVEDVNLSELVHDTAKLVKSSIPSKVQVHYDLADDLPSLECDATQVRQVVMNLITNAAEAVDAEQGMVAVTTRTVQCDAAWFREAYFSGLTEMPAGQYLSLEVSDNGCGMDSETQARIFDPFFTTKFAGRGLGLAAVLGIIRGQKGAIRIESAVGEGSRFVIVLPLGEGARRVKPADRTRKKKWMAEGLALVIDDEDLVRRMGERMLQRVGFEVVSASNGPGALDILQKADTRLRLVVLDLTMPEMSGEEVFRAIREMRPRIPILVSSGYDQEEMHEDLRNDRYSDFIQKPYLRTQLAAKLEELMSR